MRRDVLGRTHTYYIPIAYFQSPYSGNLNLKLNNKINLSYNLSCRDIMFALVESSISFAAVTV